MLTKIFFLKKCICSYAARCKKELYRHSEARDDETRY